MVKIRLARFGSVHNPHYRMVVTDSRRPRGGGYLENLGHYDPRKKIENYLDIDVERARHWLTQGAQPTDTARRLLKQAGVYKDRTAPVSQSTATTTPASTPSESAA